MIRVFYTSGDGSGWAIDEDLRQTRESLHDVARETSLARAEVVHSPFWMALAMHPAAALAERFVIAHADNPPFFYVKQPEFAWAQRRVDLWIARSREAFEQFRALELPVEYIPYTIDPGVFRPVILTAEDKKALRRRLGLPQEGYLIANFHRDSEGSNLNTPKLQKSPELLLMILRRLKKRGVDFHVVLAGPRRHWLRARLTEEDIPFTFVGQPGIEGDDFGVNILDRAQLNELYNAVDLYVIPSRWEGGPQSVMEAAACRCKILSISLGVARDLLEPECFFRTSAQAAEMIARDISENHLSASVEEQHRKYEARHTTKTMAEGLQALYARLPSLPEFSAKTARGRHGFATMACQFLHAVRRRLPNRRISPVAFRHVFGQDAVFDEIMKNVRDALEHAGIDMTDRSNVPIVLGWEPPDRTLPSGVPVVQFLPPDAPPGLRPPQAVIVAQAVEDTVNRRSAGSPHAEVVIPFIFQGDGRDGPLVIEQGDRMASVRIWKALLSGRPVLYPDDSAYGEQVFHAGLPYHHPAEIPTALKAMENGLEDFKALIRAPRRKTSAQALKKLLIELA